MERKKRKREEQDFREKLSHLHHLIEREDWKDVNEWTQTWKPTFATELQDLPSLQRCTPEIGKMLEFKRHPKWMQLAKDANLMFRLDSFRNTWEELCATTAAKPMEPEFVACKQCLFYRALLLQLHRSLTDKAENKLITEAEHPEEHELYFEFVEPAHLKTIIPKLIHQFAPKLKVCVLDVRMDIYKVDELTADALSRHDQKAFNMGLKFPTHKITLPDIKMAKRCFEKNDLIVLEIDVEVWDEWDSTGHKLKQPEAHSNIVLMNKKLKEIELFDPHGRYGFDDQPRLTIRILATLLNSLVEHKIITQEALAEYAKLPPWKLCPKPFAWQKSFAVCAYYSLTYMFLRILCPQWKREDLLPCLFQTRQQEKELLNALHQLIKQSTAL